MTEQKRFSGYETVVDLSDEDAELTHVQKGSPCGEYLRRFWHPVLLSDELEDLPKLIKILGEELVLFRDKSGDIGLLHKHCAHRGASLEYGIVAEHGIICCYHGWHYNIDGSLISAGSEPANSPIHKRVVQGAYPTYEYEGIIFAYLGPIDVKGNFPDFPKFDTLINSDAEKIPFSITTHCNWLQVYENTQDPIHVLHLHARSSGIQFGVASGVDQIIDYRETPIGLINVQTRKVDKNIWVRCTESIMPNMNQGGAIWEEAEKEKFLIRSAFSRWMVPLDNFTTKTIGWRFFSKELDPRDQGDKSKVGIESIDFVGQTKFERSYEESQLQPGDYEAQVSQRTIARHNLENLASSDRGVVKIRELIRKNIRASIEDKNINYIPYNQKNEIPTYVQDTVIKSNLDFSKQREFSKKLVDQLLEDFKLSLDERRRNIYIFCENFKKNNC